MLDNAGNFYIGQALGTEDIIKRQADGTFVQRFDVATEIAGSDWIDLASDQRTMYYTSEGRRILRYDVVADVQLSDFAALPGFGRAFALRLLADGGLLVADLLDIKRLDGTGTVVQTYDLADHDFWFALILDPDGTSFWSGDVGTGEFHKFDIAAGGTPLLSVDTGTGSFNLAGLTVLRELTQAILAPTPVAGISEPTTLAVFGIGLVCLGYMRRRPVV